MAATQNAAFRYTRKGWVAPEDVSIESCKFVGCNMQYPENDGDPVLGVNTCILVPDAESCVAQDRQLSLIIMHSAEVVAAEALEDCDCVMVQGGTGCVLKWDGDPAKKVVGRVAGCGAKVAGQTVEVMLADLQSPAPAATK